MERKRMDPEIDIEAAVELWFRLFPDGTASINYALQSPLGKPGAKLKPNQIPSNRQQQLVVDFAGMAKDILPTSNQNMSAVRDEFRRNGYNDVPYDHCLPQLKGKTAWYKSPSSTPLRNMSNQTSGRVLRNEAQTNEKYCVFCFNNKAEPIVYKSHRCKDDHGRVCCPILRTLVCPFCKATGPTAHTPKYCPIKPIITPEYCEAVEQKNKEKETFMRLTNKENTKSTIWPLDLSASNNKKYNIPKKHVHQDMNRRKSMRM